MKKIYSELARIQHELNAPKNLFNKFGADFKRHFDENTYKEFFKQMGIENVSYHVCEGRMNCDVAVFENI